MTQHPTRASANARVALCLAALCSAASVPIAAAGTCDVPSDDYPLVQRALDDPDCSIVEIGPGELLGNMRTSRPVEIRGSGLNRTILRAFGGSALVVTASPTIISDLTITGGDTNNGAGILVTNSGGAQIDLTRVRLMSNFADARGGAMDAGRAVVTITDSVIDYNTGGGVYSGGAGSQLTITGSRFIRNLDGAIYAENLVMRNSVVDLNRGRGAAVTFESGSVEDSSITRNRASDLQRRCGGMAVFYDGTIDNTTFSGNIGPGGALCHFYLGSLVVTNSTFSDNVGRVDAGGVSLNSERPDAETTLQNVTFANNTGARADAIRVIFGTVRLRGTAISGVGDNLLCEAGLGTILSLGSNAAEDDSCNLVRDSDQPGVADLLLGPLQDNGGANHTHALLPGSPAIDGVASDNCPDTDQRGVLRPQGGACDVGAFEVEEVEL